MTWTIITLTIITYLSTDHPKYNCFLSTSTPKGHEFEELDIDSANKLMWELKAKGWETTTTTSYNRFTPRVYEKEIRWLHLD